MPNLLERLRSALVDRYAVESEIGRGGMATVFLAEDLKHHREVAIKVLHPELAASVGGDRFLREIEAVASLTHPHVLPLFDSGEVDGLLFYVMPYVEGESLRQRLDRDRQLPIDEAIRITRDVSEALDHAHRHGLIHRDIKPGNILLEEGHAVVTDFGIARAISEAGRDKVTATGMAVGTPAYMSPEQAAGDEIDERSDVYALACVLYEMLAGEPPLLGSSPQSTAAKRLTDRPTPLPALRDTVSPDLDQVLSRALERAPVDRYETAPAFEGALASHARTGVDRRSHPHSRRREWIVGLGTALVLATVATAVWFARRPEDSVGVLDPDAIAVVPFRVTGTSDALQRLAEDVPDLFWMKVTGDYGPRTIDPGTVTSLWRAAGGTTESPLPEAQALRIAQTVGAGRLVLGVVAGTESNMTVTATLLEVPSGEVRASQTAVEGPYAEYLTISDALITQLLAKAVGQPMYRLPSLSRYAPEAVQAGIEGRSAWMRGESVLATQLFDRALALDSTFVLAALDKYVHGESDAAAARYAWDHRHELTARDQMYLKAVAGWRFGATPTVVARIAQFDSIGVDDWEVGTDIPYNLHEFGQLARIPGWRERNRTAREKMLQVNPESHLVAYRLFELASDKGDTLAMRVYAEHLAQHAKSPTARLAAAGTALRTAAVAGDTAKARRLWKSVPSLADNAPYWLEALIGLLLEGRGLVGLDEFFTAAAATQTIRPGFDRDGLVWARCRGRYHDWTRFRESYRSRSTPVAAAVARLRDALFLGEPEDSATRAAAVFLAQVARGDVVPPPFEKDPTPVLRNIALSRCWSELWRTTHGDVSRARETIQYLREGVPLPYRWAVCAGIVEVLLTEHERGDLKSSVSRLDSIVRSVPMEDPYSGIRDGTHFVDNLFLARLLRQVGYTDAALEAARRARPWQSILLQTSSGMLIDLLREEARLAATVGDTAGAIDTYQHYFALRDQRPDHPPWAAQWDSMRVEYGAVTGVENSSLQ
jgi:tRNA A-37 threonylcarbamoyl transferase component Bud32